MTKKTVLKKVHSASVTAMVVLPMVISAALANPAFAETKTPEPSVKSTKVAEAQTQRVDNLKKRADNEIDKRVTSLTTLITKINANKRLTSAEKSKFTTDIQNNINDLKALKIKIDADTDATTLQADVKSIVDSYRIYLLYMPKIKTLEASAGLSTVADNLTTLATKLNTKINQAKTDGKDVTAMQTLYADMLAKIADAKTQFTNAETTVVNLSPTDYPGNKTKLEQGRDLIKKALDDFKAARDDAKKIAQDLKVLYPNLTVTPKESGTPVEQ